MIWDPTQRRTRIWDDGELGTIYRIRKEVMGVRKDGTAKLKDRESLRDSASANEVREWFANLDPEMMKLMGDE